MDWNAFLSRENSLRLMASPTTATIPSFKRFLPLCRFERFKPIQWFSQDAFFLLVWKKHFTNKANDISKKNTKQINKNFNEEKWKLWESFNFN